MIIVWNVGTQNHINGFFGTSAIFNCPCKAPPSGVVSKIVNIGLNMDTLLRSEIDAGTTIEKNLNVDTILRKRLEV